jgi:phage shock protein A
MGIFQRISDIISANLNEMTESFEDPEKMLRQAVREMEQSIGDATQETAKVIANEKLLEKERTSNSQQAQQWQKKAEQAVSAGDDQLARKALSRKVEHEKLVVALDDQLKAAHDASRTLKHQLDGMKAKLAEAKRNLATLSARKRAADFKKKMHTSAAAASDVSGLDDNAFAKFDRLRGRVEQAEAEAEALAELRGSTETLENEEIASIAPRDDIEAQLRALKNKQP